MQLDKGFEIFGELIGANPAEMTREEENAVNAELFAKLEQAYELLALMAEPRLVQESELSEGDGVYRTSKLVPFGVSLTSDVLSSDARITIVKSVCEVFSENTQIPEEINWDDETEYTIIVNEGDDETVIAYVESLGDSDCSSFDSSFNGSARLIDRVKNTAWAAEVTSVIDAIRADAQF